MGLARPSSTTGRLAKCLACGTLTRARVWAHRLPLCETCVRDHGEAIIELAHLVAEGEQRIARSERRALFRAAGLSTFHDTIEQMHDDARSGPALVALRRLEIALGPERRRLRRTWRTILACCPIPTQPRRGETSAR